MSLETNRLLLRPWSEEDAAELYELAKDPRIGPAAGWQPHKSTEESRKIIRDILTAPECYAILDKETGTLLGSIGLSSPKESNLKLQEGQAELGIWLGVPYWGHGYAQEATKELTRHGFEELHLSRIYATCFLENKRSSRMQTASGFRYRKTLKNQYCAMLNEVRDLELRVLINPTLEI